MDSCLQLSQSRRDALASNQDAYTAVFEQFVQGRSMSVSGQRRCAIVIVQTVAILLWV